MTYSFNLKFSHMFVKIKYCNLLIEMVNHHQFWNTCSLRSIFSYTWVNLANVWLFYRNSKVSSMGSWSTTKLIAKRYPWGIKRGIKDYRLQLFHPTSLYRINDWKFRKMLAITQSWEIITIRSSPFILYEANLQVFIRTHTVFDE